MRLDEYQWSHNPRGMHNPKAANFFNVPRLVSMKMGWAKIVAVDREFLNIIPQLVGNNITPIVRLWRPRFGAGAVTSDMITAWKEYKAAGVRWFEFYNEPNLEAEWPEGSFPDFNNVAGVIAPLMQNWLTFAETIIAMGAYPAFPALAEAVGQTVDVGSWLIAMMSYLADTFYDRFRAVANSGMWCATHPYFYNHFYQEGAGPLQARLPGLERADEGGWHFEYPYDPITQANDPGLTAVSGGPKYPLGDPIGLTGVGHAFIKRFQDYFGGGAVPVVGTEGGITPVPGPTDSRQLDTRFPPFTWDSHAEATVAAFDWIAQESPPWMFGLTLWKDDEYFEGPAGPLPATRRLTETMPSFKRVPPLEALDGPGPRVAKVPVGPGPIHGSPDYHFLIIAPGFNTNWFFQEARDYWDRFRPTVVSSDDFIAYLPYARSLGVTVLCTPEAAGYMTQQIKERWPTVWFDLIVGQSAEDIARVLRERAYTGRRFG
jgi:hypothetical protein